MPDETVTRRELGELRRSVNSSLQRLERAMRQHQQEHKEDAEARAEQREAEAHARISGRRWLIGTLIAVAAVIEAPLLYLVTHLH